EISEFADRLEQLGGATEEAAAELLPEAENAAADGRTGAASGFGEFVIESDTEASTDETTFEWNTVGEESEAPDSAQSELDIERGFSFEAVVAEELSDAKDLNGVQDEERKIAMRAQELESVDFYIAQGYADIAIDTLNLLESQFGTHPDIEARRRQLTHGGESPAVLLSLEPEAEPRAAVPAAEFSFAPENVDFTMPAAEEPKAKTPAAPAIDAGLAEIFEEYRVSAESESNGNGDYETHYNLGLAYQEMDLFEEALEEFQMAVGLVSPEDGTARYLQCCNLLGHCFMNKGVPRLAVKWFNKGLNAPNTSADERQALRFDLAAAYEQAGDLDQAKNLFTEIYGVNVSYRGVNERLKALESRMA
ncbi:MAG TPA: tetratricopeptide repeat protein, partial [Pyrinomonadaceae bacterium]|nr:tetratricopeptide repeat protein [Pyrinomonadaceae bacterium]